MSWDNVVVIVESNGKCFFFIIEFSYFVFEGGYNRFFWGSVLMSDLFWVFLVVGVYFFDKFEWSCILGLVYGFYLVVLEWIVSGFFIENNNVWFRIVMGGFGFY